MASARWDRVARLEAYMRTLMRGSILLPAALLLAATTAALPAVTTAASALGTSLGTARAEAAAATPVQIYGAWHCSNDACTWGTVRTLADFDANNHWLIDRGDGKPSVNLVVLSFVNPLKLLNGTTDSGDTNGVPVGMTSAIVNYFTSHGVRVMLSIGGITYVTAWDTALSQNATLLGQKA